MVEIIYGKIYNTSMKTTSVLVRYGEEEEKTVSVMVGPNTHKSIAKIKQSQRGGIVAKFEVEDNNWKLVGMASTATETPLKELLNKKKV